MLMVIQDKEVTLAVEATVVLVVVPVHADLVMVSGAMESTSPDP